MEDFSKLLEVNNTSSAMRIYIYELLLRTHMCAISGTKRLINWIDGIEYSPNNYIILCSSLRGLLESCGDTYDGLNLIAISLAKNQLDINKALAGKAETIINISELEDNLIHFSYASKAIHQQTNNEVYRPKRPSSYVELLNKGSTYDFYKLYEFLCEITHPASTSLGYNFKEKNGCLIWSGKKDRDLSIQLLTQNKELLKELLMLGFNPIFLALKTLNLFKIDKFYTSSMDSINVSSIPAWGKIENCFKV